MWQQQKNSIRVNRPVDGHGGWVSAFWFDEGVKGAEPHFWQVFSKLNQSIFCVSPKWKVACGQLKPPVWSVLGHIAHMDQYQNTLNTHVTFLLFPLSPLHLQQQQQQQSLLSQHPLIFSGLFFFPSIFISNILRLMYQVPCLNTSKPSLPYLL